MKRTDIDLEGLSNLVAKGYLVLDVEPDNSGKHLYWLHMSHYDANHNLVKHSDFTSLDNASQTKQLLMLRLLDKPYSKLALPKEKVARQLKAYLNKQELVDLPIFGYSVGQVDLPILNELLPNYDRPIYDLALAYAKATGETNIKLDNLANQLSLGTSPKQAVANHNPMQDVELTNIVLKGMLALSVL